MPTVLISAAARGRRSRVLGTGASSISDRLPASFMDTFTFPDFHIADVSFSATFYLRLALRLYLCHFIHKMKGKSRLEFMPDWINTPRISGLSLRIFFSLRSPNRMTLRTIRMAKTASLEFSRQSEIDVIIAFLGISRSSHTRAHLVVLARCHCRRRKRARFSEGHVRDRLEVSRLSLMSPRFVSWALRNILSAHSCGA